MLDDSLSAHLSFPSTVEKGLFRLGIETVRDLIYYFPVRYDLPGERKCIVQLQKGEKVTIYGKIEKPKTAKAYRKNIPLAEARLTDDTGSIKVVWFRQAYMAKKLPDGAYVQATGTISEGKDGHLYLPNPLCERITEIPPDTDSLFSEESNRELLVPVYPETRGVTSRWFHYNVRKLLPHVLSEISDPLPKNILSQYKLPTLKTALVWIHTPQSENDFAAARKRFAFEEIFLFQLTRLRDRQRIKESAGISVPADDSDITNFFNTLPYSPTHAQKKAVDAILKDIQRPVPMLRLLEGDVGSGKTAVAAAISYAIARNRTAREPFQVAYLAPTEILAEQQFQTLSQLFGGTAVQMGLITGSGCKKFPSKVTPTEATSISRSQLLKWIADGSISILVGTHALIQKSVKFKNLTFAIIDEQHRFGVKQRAALLSDKDTIPHLLSMTATPIPRTLALTLYGDLELTLLDELPPDRKQIQTEAVSADRRARVYEFLKQELDSGRQAYVICPRVNEPDRNKELALQTKSVKEERQIIEKLFPDRKVGMLHGKMKPKEKEDVMRDFLAHDIDILIATSVVEVGVNVPNATVIIIEGAERFGLAQLHQLRGRVQRSSHQPYCFLFVSENASIENARLKALVEAKNGFELAERDLSLRGSGSLAGGNQWGVSDIAMDALQNIKMVEAARTEAHRLLENDPQLKSVPALSLRMEQIQTKDVHWE